MLMNIYLKPMVDFSFQDIEGTSISIVHLLGGQVCLEACVFDDGHDDLLVVAEGAVVLGVPDALDHLEVLHPEFVAIEHGG